MFDSLPLFQTELEHSRVGTVYKPINIDGFLLHDKLKEGTLSLIVFAVNNYTYKDYICKITPKNIAIGDTPIKKYVDEEIRITNLVDHPYICKIKHSTEDDKNIYIFTKYEQYGDLSTFFEDISVENDPRNYKFVKHLFKQLLETINYLHSQKICHCDIKLENILIDKFYNIKLTDFGCSVVVKDDFLIDEPRGTRYYLSPECITQTPYNGKTSDVWSCGVVLYNMVTGSYPWKLKKDSEKELYHLIKTGNYKIPQYVQEDCASLIRSLLTVDFKKRITIEKALKHPFLQ